MDPRDRTHATKVFLCANRSSHPKHKWGVFPTRFRCLSAVNLVSIEEDIPMNSTVIESRNITLVNRRGEEMTNRLHVSLVLMAVLLAPQLVSSQTAVAQSHPVNDPLFFSGPVITGPEYCLNRSFGGPVTYPHDGDGDGIADVCSLPRTRRAAAARQNALERLGEEQSQRLQQMFLEECPKVPATFGETKAEAKDECATGVLRQTQIGNRRSADSLFFSGPVVTGPEYCLNRSFGGPVTYPHDGDGDGIADVCSLPRTRRAAAARQNALERLGEEQSDRLQRLSAEECSNVPATFGETKAEAKDECVNVGNIEVYVHYCAPHGTYSAKQMSDEVARLNQKVTKFFQRESSGLAYVQFILGQTISPDIQWQDTNTHSMHGWYRQMVASEGHYKDPCNSSIPQEWRSQQILILAAVPHDNYVAGYAYTGGGLAVIPTPDKYTFGRYAYNVLVAHELGHSAFALEHTSEDAPRSACTEKWPLMDRRVCSGMWSPEILDNAEITCEQRKQLNWPCRINHGNGSHGPNNQMQYPFRNSNDPGINEYQCRRYNSHTSDGSGYILTGTGDIDPWAFFGGECTSYVAFRLNQDQTNVRFHNQYLTPGYPNFWTPKWGHAIDWANRAREVGIAVDIYPSPGSVAYWDSHGSNTAGYLGHLAYVEQVNPDGSIVISDMNWKSSCQVRENITLQRGLVGPDSMQWPDKFIHLEARDN